MTVRICPLAYICLLALTVISCGQDESSSKLNQSNPELSPLIVVMGGNTSCQTDSQGRPNSPFGMSLYPPTFELIKDLRSRMGIDPKLIITCYDETPNVSYSMTGHANEIFRGSREEFDAMLAVEVTPETPVVLAGHSYGGWLAMKSSLELAESRIIAGLVTIDPISRVNCTYNLPFGCQESPTDIVSSERAFLNERSESWINLYQDKTWYLHASPYSEADINEKIAASHSEIDTHERTWEHIRGLMERHY